MKQSAVPISPPARRRNALLALTLIVLAALGISVPTAASAFESGQQEVWTQTWGTGEGEFFNPGMLAVDSDNGNVFVSNLLPGFNGIRVQEFSESGEFLGETEPIETDGLGQYAGMAMDPQTGEFYLLEAELGTDTEPGMEEENLATRILAFEATPTADKKLEPAVEPEIEVPAANQANTVFNPRQLTLDPKTGELIILGENRQRQAVLQRIDTAGTGTVGTAFVDTSEALLGEYQGRPVGQLGLAVSADGTTYVLASKAGPQTELHAYTLPPEFDSTSALIPVPGFEDSAAAESWPDLAVNRFLAEPPEPNLSFGMGAQIAVSSAADGSGETLYFKVMKTFSSESIPGVFYVRAYSLSEGATAAVYGGGAEEECGIQRKWASLAAGPDGSVTVLDQGEPLNAVGQPSYSPYVMRFGAEAGVSCPVPAAGFNLEPGASVPAGTTVTMNGDSELGTQTLAQTTWKIEGPEELTETVAGPTQTFSHKFEAEGTYTVRMKIKTPFIDAVGTTFSAPPQTLVVTAGGGATEFPLTVTKSGTGTGTVNSTPAGIACGTTCSAEFEAAEEVELAATPAAGSEFVEWTGACIGAGPCKVPMTAAKTVNAVFTLEAPPVTEFTLKVTKAGTGTGSVQCNGGTCAEKYAAGTRVTLTAVADSGSTFAGWSGGVCTGTGTCVVTIEGATTITATFNTNPPSNNPPADNPPANNPPAGNPPSSKPPANTPPSNTPKPGAVKANGTMATLTVTVPGPGTVAVSGKGLIGAKVKAKGAGPVKVSLKLSSAEKKTLAKKGKVTIKVAITFTPTGGTAGTATKTVTFKAKKAKH